MSPRIADLHVGPAGRRWIARIGLAVVIAIGIGYVPGQLLRRDPKAIELTTEIDKLDAEARSLADGNAAIRRDIDALRTDVHAIEAHARADLGMVYPNEIVIRVGNP